MNSVETKKRIDKLKQEINFHRYNYHVLDKETLSEGALDGLKNELFRLEQEHPELVTPDSPTQRVGGKPLPNFKKVQHSSPMLSLFDAFSEEDILNWAERVRKIKDVKYEYYTELKLDGLAIALQYQNGLLVLGATRGDGKIGEDVTQNIKTVESIPLQLRRPEKTELAKLGFSLGEQTEIYKMIEGGLIEIRGEAIMTNSVFKKLNEKYLRNKQPILANTRNAVAGSIRQLDSSVVAERHLDFYVYDLFLHGEREGIVKTREQANGLAKCLGLKTLSQNKLLPNLSEVFAFQKYWEKHRLPQ